MHRHLAISLALALGIVAPVLSQDSASKEKSLDVRSSVGDLHLGKDADAKQVGLPLYPGAQLKSNAEDQSQANLSIATESFGMKLVVANYISDDAPGKLLEFYRDKLKKYGKVLECHSAKLGDVSAHDDDKDSHKSKELKCDDNSGPVTELKVGTDDNQHIVAVEPGEGSKGSKFTLIYVHTRGQQGDI
jgi:hypothetical protein